MHWPHNDLKIPGRIAMIPNVAEKVNLKIAVVIWLFFFPAKTVAKSGVHSSNVYNTHRRVILSKCIHFHVDGYSQENEVKYKVNTADFGI